uniref:Uncharacterized protein n=1 Tax=Lobelia fervens subsp. fervens TaxID=2041125 RepID=A0A291EXJ6_9ASTR|nr:hypothetical protein Lo_fe_fe1Pt0345 [Lobelia fervens subsp. fervens]
MKLFKTLLVMIQKLKFVVFGTIIGFLWDVAVDFYFRTIMPLRPNRKSKFSQPTPLGLDTQVYRMLLTLDLLPLVNRIIRRVDLEYQVHGDETVAEEVRHVAFAEGIRYAKRNLPLFCRTEKMFKTAEYAASICQVEACEKAPHTLQTKAIIFFWAGVLFTLGHASGQDEDFMDLLEWHYP